MENSKTLFFLDRIIHLNLMDYNPSHPLEDAKLLVDEKGEYSLFFTKKALLQDRIVIHETWHLFFDILSTFDEGKTSFEDLKKEIYTYTFSSLFSEIKEGLSTLC